ncbi:MAG: hypothetical protein KDA41_23025, partial [Planctomycetales bacterium]|nr:hypothetical protein [Planctomycetales bacterium]
KARGRMNLQTFVSICTWCLFGWLLAAVVALAIPKLWAMGFDARTAQIYTWSVAGGALGLGLLTGLGWSWLRRRGELEAAIEIDHRFGLKERVSSSLALTPDELESEAGRALVADAVRRVERVDVGERFGVRARWTAALPLVPALAVFLLAMVVKNAETPANTTDPATALATQTQIRTVADNLKKPIEDLRKKADEQGLADASDLFKKLDQGLDGVHEKSKADRNQAMVELNNLAQQLKDRAGRLKDADEIKNQMNNLKDLQKGPADKLAQAMKEGDFQQALNEMKKLQEKLKNDELTKEEKQQLQQQMQQMQDKLQQMADAHQQAMDDLKQQIEQAQKQGDLAQAGQLQQKLDQLQQQQPAMDKLQQMANQLGQAADALQQGDPQAAGEQLDQLAQQLQQMQDMEDELQMLEDAMDQLAQAKDAMNCKQCQGEGCQQCQGQGQGGDKQGDKPGNGLGAGRGQGARPEEEHETGSYDSQVRTQVTAGQAYVVGTTGGTNKSGAVREEIKNSIRTAAEGSANPLTNERLPRSQRDHVKEYYDRFRGD